MQQRGDTATLASRRPFKNAGLVFLFGKDGMATINGKIVFLLLLVAICVALSYAELWSGMA